MTTGNAPPIDRDALVKSLQDLADGAFPSGKVKPILLQAIAALESQPVPVEPECVKYLAQYEQADEDGIIVKVSRQAIHETLAHIDSLQSELQRAQKLAEENGRIGAQQEERAEAAESLNKRYEELLREPSEGMIVSGKSAFDYKASNESAGALDVWIAMSEQLLKEAGE